MPYYLFRCKTCGIETVLLQKYHDEPPECPERAALPLHGPMERQMAAPACFKLKGEGFYRKGQT